MKESNILASNATIKQHQKKIFMDTKGQHMKELESVADIVMICILLGLKYKAQKKYIYNY